MKFTFTLLLIFLSFAHTFGQSDFEYPELELWPTKIGPGSDTLSFTEIVTERTIIGTCTIDRAFEKVTIPTLTVVAPENPNGTVAIICPGGAYKRVVYDVEGMDVARMLNDYNITGYVLKYRLPYDAHINHSDVALQDAQRAVRYLKSRAEELNIDTTKIIIIGASAGGHNAAMLATNFDKEVYAPIDRIDTLSARPTHMILLYPVVSMDPTITHIGTRDILLGSNPTQTLIDEYSAEKHAKANSPITFIAHASDDGSVSPKNSQRLVDSLKAKGVAAEVHLYKNGGHGKGICKAVDTDFINWTKDAAIWLYKNNLTEQLIDTLSGELISSNLFSFEITPNPIAEQGTINYLLKNDSQIEIDLKC